MWSGLAERGFIQLLKLRLGQALLFEKYPCIFLIDDLNLGDITGFDELCKALEVDHLRRGFIEKHQVEDDQPEDDTSVDPIGIERELTSRLTILIVVIIF